MKGRGKIVDVDVFTTGVMSIDMALGCGGLPQGRIMELYGPESSGKTTTCLQFIAACQKHTFEQKEREGVCAFIDAEHALDPTWAENIGVDMDQLLVSQPNSGEEAITIVEYMVKSSLVDLIVIDSVAALVPQVELDGELKDANIGAHARLMSKAMRILNGSIFRSNTTVIFINQIREKVGVIFGCLHADTLIDFVDGRSIPIRQVVEERITDEVWSYNTKTEQFESKNITDWHENGQISEPEDYLHFTLRGPGTKNGTMQITVTINHRILTIENEWVMASDLSKNDELVTQQPCYVLNKGILNGTYGQFLSGVLSGDSHISKSHKKISASLRLRDNIDCDYMKWKVQKLRKFLQMNEYPCRSGIFYESIEVFEFSKLKKEFPNRDPMILLDNFSWLGFAVWIMDDAIYERGRYQLSIKRFRGDFGKLDEISIQLDELGLYHHMSKGGRITFDTNVSELIAGNIFAFVPKCMDRKLPINLRDQYCDFDLERQFSTMTVPVKIVDIRCASQRQMKQKTRYDISISDNCCYMAGGNPNGVIVHNSPEVTPGGRALKFYASIRAEVKRVATLKDGEDVVGFKSKIKIVKNKVAPPFMTGEFDICVGHPARPIYGIDAMSSLIFVAEDMKIITKSGSHYAYGNQKIGNGMGKASAFLQENADIAEKIRKQTYDIAFGSLEKIKIQDDPEAEDNLDNELLDED